MTDVKQDVDVLLVFEVSIEPHDVFVVQRPVDLDLACKLLPSLGTSQVGLRHHFESPGLVLIFFSLNWFESADLVALGKATLSKESLADVFDDLALFHGVIGVDWLAFLFDNLDT